MRCSTYSAVGESEDGTRAAVLLRCRKWDCPSCAPRERHKLKRRLIAGSPERLLTLTCNPSHWPTTEEAYRGLSKAINRLFKSLRRRFPNGHLEYALVWEKTKKGLPHCHLLLRGPYIPQKIISAQWARLTNAPIIDIRHCKSAPQAAAYISKYLTKDPHAPRGMKRYRFSRAYAPTPRHMPLSALLGLTTWRIIAADLATIATLWTAHNLRLSTAAGIVLVGTPRASPEPSTTQNHGSNDPVPSKLPHPVQLA